MNDTLKQAGAHQQPVQLEAAKGMLRAAVEGEAGYALGLRMQPQELACVRAIISDHWLGRLREVLPSQVDEYAALGIENYHRLIPHIDHSQLWPKSVRILPASAIAVIRSMTWMKELVQEWGNFVISDEENVGHEEVYWRIVRPHEPTDIGPLHADSWFWELGHGRTPENCSRIKVWCGIFCEPGRNGLLVVPGSHQRQWRYHGVDIQGVVKPRIDEDVHRLKSQLAPVGPGEAVVFHDRLLHGGAVNGGFQTRVSIEFTMFVPLHVTSPKVPIANIPTRT